jgi:NCS2 family nucleobase:cation symporter-2
MSGRPAPVRAADGFRARLGALLSPPAGTAAPKQPAALSYGLEQWPPALVLWISAVQHVAMMAIFMVYPLIVAREAGLAPDRIINMMQLGALVLAAAVLLQALPRGPVGARLLAPSIFTGVYLGPSLLAVKTGGLPLLWGMTIFAGVVEAALSRIWVRLRPFIPPESVGLVVFLVGAIIALAAARVLLGTTPGAALAGRDGAVAGMALAVMAALNVWNKGRLKLFCILIGMIVGYLAAAAMGVLTAQDLAVVMRRPLLALPSLGAISYAFDWNMVIPFAITGLAAAMNTTAVATTYQRLTDADWVRPGMTAIGRGVLGDGIATTIAGLLGTYGLTVSSANVGLVAATGVASRVIAFAVAAILLAVAMEPRFVGVLTIMPRPVMASAMLFTAAFIMISGVQIVATRLLDGRRTLVVGMGLMAFLLVSVYPAAFAGAPAWAQPIVGSPLVLAIIVALLLNLVFRIGIRRTVQAAIDPLAPDQTAITRFIERNAAIWGARRDAVKRVEFAVQQTIEALAGVCETASPIGLAVSYDEFVIDVAVTYDGAPLAFPANRPTPDQIAGGEDGYRQLAGYLIAHYADRVEMSRQDGRSALLLYFDH